ncbi:MAG: esterase, partial [Verrucomicrobiales bacterium]|nr:esterase [Verrucomicrobiales bacterium]
ALPLVESLYRVKSTRKNRAIAGLSMGGLHSLTIGLNELDKFSRIGAFSAAIPAPEAVEAAFKNPDQTNEQIELLWIACGKTDFLLEENRDFVDRLKKTGIDHQFLLTEGGHSWPVWRQYLAEFAPLLFR